MSGDFSRDTSRAAQLARYTRVLLQQGRPLLDAEFNEQSAIHHDLLRTFIADMVGSGWRPAEESFRIIMPGAPAKSTNFKITKGHFYVDGILCDNPVDCTYVDQPFRPKPVPALVATGNFVAYIECWERHLCAVQQPALREIALGGPDTASRAQIVWQVRVATAKWVEDQLAQLNAALDVRINAEVNKDEKKSLTSLKGALNEKTEALSKLIGKKLSKTDDDDVSTASEAWFEALAAAPPRLRAMAKRDASDNEACSISPDSIYRGRENQLYRVEIHEGGTLAGDVKPTFKWSRENGSVLFAVQSGKSIAVAAPDGGGVVVTLTIPLETLGHDRRTGLCVGDWVEVTSESFELEALAPPLGQVKRIDRTRRSVEVEMVKVKRTFDFDTCTLLRRWDQTEHLDANGTVVVAEVNGTNAWTPLERGVQIQFQPGGVYRTGDYWLIPARVASGDVLWPQVADVPSFVAPDGITRHRAAIGHGS
ncbi:DUF6519 domain-containing protein [Rhizobacter sp. Root1221]|uniref:DUF6519 domain-containing protein n=1 Tax=Rhizobacter sp. Root1221 TaxID=1736433 RepID=UPI0006FACD45|nr:DUF6519 domain-containing protein [Rhizobacter sp. Root1221]KQW02341.1 hypothetical protein ASC87_14070 [Rhizobacter sp. Root1221]